MGLVLYSLAAVVASAAPVRERTIALAAMRCILVRILDDYEKEWRDLAINQAGNTLII